MILSLFFFHSRIFQYIAQIICVLQVLHQQLSGFHVLVLKFKQSARSSVRISVPNKFQIIQVVHKQLVELWIIPRAVFCSLLILLLICRLWNIHKKAQYLHWNSTKVLDRVLRLWIDSKFTLLLYFALFNFLYRI